jgi:hypothetical protein
MVRWYPSQKKFKIPQLIVNNLRIRNGVSLFRHITFLPVSQEVSLMAGDSIESDAIIGCLTHSFYSHLTTYHYNGPYAI